MAITNFTYTLIIPSRNRAHTAVEAVRSVLNTRYPQVQIIVADNSDNDELQTLLTAEHLIDKVDYSRSSETLSMRDNWERAVALAKGDYVSIIGDDDAVMPDAFLLANVILSKLSHVDVLRCGTANYKWPDYPFPGRRNYLQFQVDDSLSVINEPLKLLKKVYDFELQIGTGFGIYYGFVRRKFLLDLKKRRGRFFIDMNPDFDSGYTALLYGKRVATCARSFFISGHSGASNSGNMRFSATLSSGVSKFARETGCDPAAVFHAQLQGVNTTGSAIISCMMNFLAEIKSVQPKLQISINKQKAFDYLKYSVTDCYDVFTFQMANKKLLELAETWGVNFGNNVRFPLPGTAGGAGLLYEQGPSLTSAENYSGPVTGFTKGPFDSLVINGAKLGWTTINDAVSVAAAVLKSPARLLEGDAAQYYFARLEEQQDEQLSIALSLQAAEKYDEAISIVSDILADNANNIYALQLLFDIHIKKEEYSKSIPVLAMMIGIMPRVVLLQQYLLLCRVTGLEDYAREIIGVVRDMDPDNPEIQQMIDEFCQ